MSNAVEVFKASTQECDDGISGLCWSVEGADPSRGYYVHEEYRDCMNSWAIPPGFNLMNRGLLAFIYLLWLLWLFFGVAILSDIFMESIENICSIKKKVMRKTTAGTMVEVEVPVWNWVVANITLMALGTSSPECLLALVETVMTLGQPTGDLGPSCIVGSAAYNLFMISAVCTVALKDGQVKRIKHIWVFCTTCAWSLWVYVWLYLVYNVISPNEVEIWEACFTLGMFPVMVYTSYAVDAKPWRPHPLIDVAPEPEVMETGGERTMSGRERTMSGRTVSGRPQDPSRSGRGYDKHHSILMYRHMAVRQMKSGNRDVKASEALRQQAARQALGLREGDALDKTMMGGLETMSARFDPSLVEASRHNNSLQKVTFTVPAVSVLERNSEARIKIMRCDGDMMSTLRVYWRTEDGTAFAGLDYEPVLRGAVVFGPGEEVKEISVRIVDDDMSEPDVAFFVALTGAEILPMAKAGSDQSPPGTPVLPFKGKGVEPSLPSTPPPKLPDGVVMLCARIPITIVDDDEGGVLMFELPTVEAGNDAKVVEVTVVRRSGSDGAVTVEYATRDGQALAGQHYTHTAGTLSFGQGETEQLVRVPLLPRADDDGGVLGARAFKIALTNPTGGASLGLRSECRVIMLPHQHTNNGSAAVRKARAGEGKESQGKGGKELAKDEKESGDGSSDGGEYNLWDDWKERFQEAALPEFEEVDEFGEPQNLWIFMTIHWLSITWKLLGATIPPPLWKGGYPAFVMSLVYIGGCVAIVKEVAELFGCMVGLSSLMIGISLVALGTSVPDTFASRLAAIHLEGADEAIGNVTGSNSVNVLLGLGLPWVIAVIYYHGFKGEKYVTPAGPLGFSSIIYFCFSAPAIGLLMFRRWKGGELGGTKFAQWTVFAILSSFWIVFLLLAGLYDQGHITSDVLRRLF